VKTFPLLASFIVVLANLTAASPVQARTWYILPDGSGDAPTIQAGIDSCVYSDTVSVACGTYFEQEIIIKSGIVLRSETGEADCVTIDARQLGRVLTCVDVDPTTTIEGFTVTGGLTEGSGSDAFGGGVYCYNSSPNIVNCWFIGNSALTGGGFACRHSSNPHIVGCLFGENSSGGIGGGMFINHSAPELYQCQFVDNLVDQDGAGICCTFSSAVIFYCLFQDNIAGIWGGAMEITGSEGMPIVANCTMVGNSAGNAGGAFFSADHCQFTLEYSIITDSHESAAIYIQGEPSFRGILCCNVFGNEIANYGGELVDQTGWNGNISASPLFCSPETDDFHLADNSPCLPGNNECGALIGAFGAGCATTTISGNSVPKNIFLSQCFPNPFNPITTIRFDLPEAQNVQLNIYAVDGEHITTLVNEELISGPHSVTWNGIDDQRRLVASGIYVYRLEAGAYVESRRMVVVR